MNRKIDLSLDTAGSSKKWCPHCHETFSDGWDLKNHFTSVHKDVKMYICKFCDRVYQTAMGLHYHIQRHSGKNYLCAVCNKTFTRDSTLKLHLRKIHMSGRCPTCKGVFRIGHEYSQHVFGCTSNVSV
ncbi:hypothetical protein Btru_029141 [Bulinus truncatus]|nr:hypothetical protein Btru_029141 [Bulinus truncatus]